MSKAPATQLQCQIQGTGGFIWSQKRDSSLPLRAYLEIKQPA